MDTTGARALAARLEAGVRPGTVVQLVTVADSSDTRLRPGDYGNVGEVKADGSVVVGWDRGFTSVTHPSRETLRALG
jgi:hypothetical protein